MALVEIYIDPAAMLAGGVLAVKLMGNTSQAVPVELQTKVFIPVGNSKDFQTEGAAFIPVSYSSADAADPAMVVGALNIGISKASLLTDTQLNRMGQWFKNSLADLVNKGIIIVKIGGSAQTAVQLISLPTS